MKKILLLVSAACTIVSFHVQAQTARVMAIHNAADPALDTVDVWLLNGMASLKLADNFGFRQSTGYFNAPASTDIRICFAGKNSTTIADTLIGFGFNLTPNVTYTLLAQGTIGGGFNPPIPFGLKVITPVERVAGTDSVYLSIVHGSTDAPEVDLQIRKGNTNIAFLDDLSYGDDVTGAVLPTDNYLIDVIISSTEEQFLTLNVPLDALGLNDSAVVVFASGFLNPSVNNNGKAFGVFAALSNSDVIEIPLQNTFRLQVFHNCADPAADTVDIWLINNTDDTNTKLLPNFVFRTATPFIDAPANKDLSIGVAPAGSSTVNDVIYTENIGVVPGGLTSIGIATGVLDTSLFEANPDAIDISFFITGNLALEEAMTAGQVALNVYHGATDAPAVDVKVAGGPTLFSNLAYTDTEDDYIEVGAQSYTLQVLAAGTSTVVAQYTAPLNGFADSALYVIASGFLSPNVPTGRDNGPAFGLFAVTKSGRVIELPAFTGLKQIAGNIDASVFPNPAKDQFEIRTKGAVRTVRVSDLSGRVVYDAAYNTQASDNTIVNVSAFNKGMYILTIETTEGVATQKLVVE